MSGGRKEMADGHRGLARGAMRRGRWWRPRWPWKRRLASEPSYTYAASSGPAVSARGRRN